ncbi:MAG: IclR family transcriptional regulator [Acetobacteraceae bacterium]
MLNLVPSPTPPRVTSRVLKALLLFGPDAAVWTAQGVASALGVSTSSAYRYLQELCAAGLLDPVEGAGYALGPALVQLDLLVRRHDPLIQAAAPVMRRLLDATTQSAMVILCRRYRDRVVCIHQEHGTRPHPKAAYERGVAMSLFSGATSKVILANESVHVQRRIYLDHEREIAERTGVRGWKEFALGTAAIRRRGYDETESDVTPGVRGIAAPVFRQARVVAAISLILDGMAFRPARSALFRQQVSATATEVSHALAAAAITRAR